MEEVYSRIEQLGKRRRFRECKEVSSRVQVEDKYRSVKTRKVRYSRGKRL